MEGKNKSTVILAVVFFAGVAAPLNQFKVPPMLHQLMHNLDISLSQSGWLMSVFALVGVILALPSGLILRRLGIKVSGLTALAALFIGSVTGGCATSTEVIMISRVIEGMGMCLIAVTGPAALAIWFPPEKRGISMGVWATWVPFGSILMFYIAPLLGESRGWQSVWVFTSAYTALLFVLFFILYRMPNAGEGYHLPESTGAAAAENPYLNRNIWMLGAVFMLYNIPIIAVKSYAPIFFVTVRDFSLLKASSLVSIVMIVAFLMGPVSGIISDKLRSRKKILAAGTLLAAMVTFMPFHVSGTMIAVSLVLIGVAGGVVPTAVFASAPEIIGDPAKVGVGISVVAFGQNLGMFIGPVAFSTAADVYGWATVSCLMFPVLLTAFILSLFIKVR